MDPECHAVSTVCYVQFPRENIVQYIKESTVYREKSHSIPENMMYFTTQSTNGSLSLKDFLQQKKGGLCFLLCMKVAAF